MVISKTHLWMWNYDLNFMVSLLVYLFVFIYIHWIKKKTLKLYWLKLVGCVSRKASKRREGYFVFLSNLSSLFIIIPEKQEKMKS